MATIFMPQRINLYPHIQLRQDDEDMCYDTALIMSNVNGCKYGLPIIILM
jgi:hypothetical protein